MKELASSLHYLVELLRHTTNDGSMLHAVLHLSSDLALATRGADEELHDGTQPRISVGLILFDPLVNHLL